MKTYKEWLNKARDLLLSEQDDHVPQTVLGDTGLEVGNLALGTGAFHFAKKPVTQEDVDLMVNSLLDSGANVLDTAADYPQDAEGKLGKAIQGRRDECVILTKCGHRTGGLRGEDWSPSLIKESVDRSLQRLDVDEIDIVLLHSCDMETLKKGEALGALVEARDKGKIRFVGYSGDNEEMAYASTLPDVSVIETSLNITELANIPLIEIAAEEGIGLLAKRSIANACWRPKSAFNTFAWEYSSDYRERLKKMDITPEEMGLEGDDDLSWVMMCLPFTLSHPIDVAIVGSTNPEHILEDIEMAKLTADEDMVKEIKEIWHNAHEGIEHYETGQRWVGLM